MKNSVKSCCKCQKIFIVYNNSVNEEFCKRCRSIKQKITEFKLSEYLQIKYKYGN